MHLVLDEVAKNYRSWPRYTVGFILGIGVGCPTASAQPAEAPPPTVTLKTWSFNSVNGAAPMGGVMIDSAGNLVGTASGGGANGDGEVFMIARTSTGFAKSPSVVASFNGTNGQTPTGGLIADANGNLFGTTEYGGKADIFGQYPGVVFEITHTASGYGKPVKVLAKLTDSAAQPVGSLTMDAKGNLYGTAQYLYQNMFTRRQGAVFELKASGSAYATAVTPIVVFDGNNGNSPEAGLLIDSNGNLFGTTFAGGSYEFGGGTVFEVLKSTTGYRSSPTTLHNFNGISASDGNAPAGSLVADASGNIFGTTESGGANDNGIVFELIKVGAGYTFKKLVDFYAPNGGDPQGGLILDAAGNLFGTTFYGGKYGDGTVFKIAKIATGYASAPTVLVNFNGSDGQQPEGNLVADSSGNLFGTTNAGGVNGQGEVFEVSGSGFVVK